MIAERIVWNYLLHISYALTSIFRGNRFNYVSTYMCNMSRSSLEWNNGYETTEIEWKQNEKSHSRYVATSIASF